MTRHKPAVRVWWGQIAGGRRLWLAQCRCGASRTYITCAHAGDWGRMHVETFHGREAAA